MRALKYTLGNTFTGNAQMRAHLLSLSTLGGLRDCAHTRFEIYTRKYIYWKSRRITEDVCIRCGKEVMILAAETMSHIYAAETK